MLDSMLAWTSLTHAEGASAGAWSANKSHMKLQFATLIDLAKFVTCSVLNTRHSC